MLPGMRLLPTLTAAVLLAASSLSSVHAQEIDLVPDAENHADWVEFIHPSEDELAYEEIGWRTQFWPAVEEAKALGRPILLWTMNGHPLGCT